MGDKLKILMCGDVEGRYDALFARVHNIDRKSGPFDALFCVGNFFGINNREFFPYKSGEKTVPIPTYILGPNNPDNVKYYPKDDEDVCENVYYLGKRGIYTSTKGLKVAYVSGISSNDTSEFEYSSRDIGELYNACVRGNPSYRGIDVLLTSQWPNNIMPDKNPKVNLTVNKTSDFPCWLTMKLRPRYHISGLEGVYYERPPFRCPNLGEHDTTLNITTRFIGLARVANPEKNKWIYALSLTPLDKMKVSELMQKTTDETDCPYNFGELEQKIFNVKTKSISSAQYFYDTKTADEDKPTKNKFKRQKTEFDQNKCWFCLASPSIEKHLIVSVGNVSYLALAKGGLVEEHFLICPIQHYQSSLGQPEDVQREINKFKRAVRRFYRTTGKVAVFFERNYRTCHMQLQIVPVKQTVANRLKDVFMDEAQSQGINLQVLESCNRLDQVLQANHPYFTVELANDEILYAKIRGNFPLNFGRDVLAGSSILNLPNRIEWKDCLIGREEEEKLVEKIRGNFERFDFTND